MQKTKNDVQYYMIKLTYYMHFDFKLYSFMKFKIENQFYLNFMLIRKKIFFRNLILGQFVFAVH